jgi:hypothetical protein
MNTAQLRPYILSQINGVDRSLRGKITAFVKDRGILLPD